MVDLAAFIPNCLRHLQQHRLNPRVVLLNLDGDSALNTSRYPFIFMTSRSKLSECIQFLPEHYMYVLFEEDGAFKTGHILSEADAALQIESGTGKRSKIKRSSCLYTFTTPAPEALLSQAETLSQEIELRFLWECAPQEEFDVEGLGADYFGHAPDTLEKTTLLLRLHSAPVYFHRRGRGRYKAAPPEILAAALAALEKKTTASRAY